MRRETGAKIGAALAAAGAVLVLGLLTAPDPSPTEVRPESSLAGDARIRRGDDSPLPGEGGLPGNALERPTGLLEGSVLSPSGHPLPGVGVTASGSGGPRWTRSVRTDGTGHFRMTLPMGDATVRATPARFLPPPPLPVRIAPGETRTAVFRLVERARGEIWVASPEGEGRNPRGTVRLTHAKTGEVFEAEGGGDEPFRFPSLPPGEYTLRMKMRGFVRDPRTPRTLVVSSATLRVQVPLSVASRLSGTVRDERGRPVGNAGVTARIRGGAPVRTVTGGTGMFAMDVPPGIFRVVVTHPEFAPAFSEPIRAIRGEDPVVDIVLDPGIPLEGIVETAEGVPIPGAEVRAQRIGPVPELTFFYEAGETDGEGAFRFGHLGEGEHVVAAKGSGFVEGSRRVFVPVKGGPLRVVLVLGGGGILRGRVRGTDGRGLEGVKVE
ncbi:MAG: carboxypeptidase-like regulatory domain-containing protein, partial [Planctomycetota bacterium]